MGTVSSAATVTIAPQLSARVQMMAPQPDQGIPGTSFNIEAIPDELKATDQWVCWKPEYRQGDAKPTKVPYDPNNASCRAATDNPETWSSFAKAVQVALASSGEFGIGFVFTANDPDVGVDLDHCRDPQTGAIKARARDIIDALASYTEISPSGTGVKVICRGAKPDGRNRRDDIEMYDTGRYFTVTGDHLPGTPRNIHGRADAIAHVHQQHLVSAPSRNESTPAPPVGSVDLGDREIIAKAMASKDGATFASLWHGEWQRLNCHSRSEADFALCAKLAFWSGGAPVIMDRLFRQSGLIRDKWDEMRGAQTYGELTITRAVQTVAEFYNPGRSRKVGTVTVSVLL
jgi:primase-polymerase (primpol)-like protein